MSAERIEMNGSCWNESPFGPGRSNGLLCELKAGHRGAHKAADAEWGRRWRDDEAAREVLDAAHRLEAFLRLRNGDSAHDKDLRILIDGVRTMQGEP